MACAIVTLLSVTKINKARTVNKCKPLLKYVDTVNQYLPSGYSSLSIFGMHIVIIVHRLLISGPDGANEFNH